MGRNVVDFYKLDPSGSFDNTGALAHMAGDVKSLFDANKPKPKLVFPEGDYRFSKWPNLPFSNLNMEADGEVWLRHIGTGDAVSFIGEEPASTPGTSVGIRNASFDGFTIIPGSGTKDSLVLSSYHAGYVDVNVHGAGPPSGAYNSAIHMKFCVCTELHPTVSSMDGNTGGSYECIGVNLDTINGIAELPTSACRIVRPVLEGLTQGMTGTATFYNETKGGTIEACKIAVFWTRGAYNFFDHVEMEANSQLDVYLTKDAHDNVFALCGDGKRSHLKIKNDGNFTTNNTFTYMGPLWS